MTNSRRSQSEKQWASRGRETTAKKPQNRKSQAHTTNGTRAERQIRLMTNSHRSQSEKLATGGGRETTAKKPYNNEVPGPHH